MKTIIALALLVSASAFAQRPPVPYPHPIPTPVMPNIYNWGNSVEVQAWNHNRMGVMCSGWVYMDMRSGHRPSTYVSMYVPARGYRSHRINIMDHQDRVIHASHSIWCR